MNHARKLRSTNLRRTLACALAVGNMAAAPAAAAVSLGTTAAAPVAVQAAAAAPSCGPVTSTSDSGAGSLRSVLACTPTGAAVTFDPATFSTPQTITLTSASLSITQSVVISGPGPSLLTLSGANARRVFEMTNPGAVNLYGMTLRNARSSANGGAIYVTDASSTLTLSDTQLISNVGNLFGGGVYSEGYVVVVGSVISRNVSSVIGGGIYAAAGGGITSSVFFSNVSQNYGAFFTAASVFVSDTVFVDNAATNGNGGALGSQNLATIAASTFIGNRSTANSGGFWAGALILTDSVFMSNTSGINGGAFTSADYAFVTGSSFVSNRSSNGGAFVSTNDTRVVDSVFRSNVATFYSGGAFNATSGPCHVTASTIDGNTSARVGGGLWCAGTAYITSTAVTSNSANWEGGGFSANSTSLFDATISGNASAANGGGGVVSGNSVIVDSHIFDNSAAGSGGGVYNTSKLTISNSLIASNTAGALGGGIASMGILTVTNSTIADNSAAAAGGALVLSGTARLVNATVFSNSAPLAAGAWFSSTSSSTEFINTLIDGAAADQCAAEPGAAAISGTSSLATDADCGASVVSSAGVASLGSYGGLPTAALLPGSPAIDAGDPVACPTTDQRGVARVGTCDIGAFESRGFRLNIVSGSGQSAISGSAFSTPLVAAFASDYAEPVGPGALLSVTSPSAGAALSPTSSSGVGDVYGMVTFTLAAGGSPGSYPITLTARGVATPAVGSMTNVAAAQPLTLSISGSGAGSVSSAPAGLGCSTSCVVTFTTYSVVTLTAAPAATSTFGGWSGACAGSGSCVVTMDQPRSISASFAMKSANAGLSSLAVAPGALVPTFAANTLNYAVAVGNAVVSIVLTPTLSDPGAAYTVTNAAGVCVGNACALNVGANAVTVTVRAADGLTVRSYVLTVTRAAAATPTPASTPTTTPTSTPSRTPAASPTSASTPTTAPTSTPSRTPAASPTPIASLTPVPSPTPSPTPAPAIPYVSPSSGPVVTSTVYILASSGLSGTTAVYAGGIKMYHIVRNDRRIEFVMKPGVAGTTVDVVIVRPSGMVTLTRSYTFEAPSTATFGVGAGGVLTTPKGVTITVPGQVALRTDDPAVAGSMTITYAPIDQPAAPTGDVPLSFFTIDFTLDGSPVAALTQAAAFEWAIDAGYIPASQLPRLYEWVAASERPTSAAAGKWVLVPQQAYDPVTRRITAPIDHPGAYSVVTESPWRQWFTNVRLP